jgi:hypothetical protein
MSPPIEVHVLSFVDDRPAISANARQARRDYRVRRDDDIIVLRCEVHMLEATYERVG